MKMQELCSDKLWVPLQNKVTGGACDWVCASLNKGARIHVTFQSFSSYFIKFPRQLVMTVTALNPPWYCLENTPHKNHIQGIFQLHNFDHESLHPLISHQRSIICLLRQDFQWSIMQIRPILLYKPGNYRKIEIFSAHNHSTVFIQR